MQWSQNLCRICGQISETCHFIYKKEVHSNIEDKIKKCLNLNLYEGDYKPKQICNDCLCKLNEFSSFIDACYVTNQKFESIYYNSSNWQSRNYEYSNHKQTDNVSNKQTADNLDYELYKNTGIVLDNLHCLDLVDNSLDLEVTTDYNAEYISLNTQSQNEKVRGYSTVLRHTQDAICSPKNEEVRIIKYNNLFTSDQNSSTSATTNLSCAENKGQSKNNTISVEELKETTKICQSVKLPKEKPKKSYKCPHCDKTYLRRGTLNSHIAIHTNVRPYKCMECSKAFAVKSNLTTHKKVHGDQHKCPFCPKKFSVPSKLSRHVRTHTNDRPFVCNFPSCNSAFTDKRNLDSHKLIHIEERKYSCMLCKKTFKTLSKLKQHSKCHSRGASFSCDLCLKKYKYKSNLISHIKKHNNICPFCKENCQSNTLLTQHLKVCKIR